MRIIRDNHEFDVDIQKTYEYYNSHSLCDCPACKNYYLQAEKTFPVLSSFLADFGVNISKPDETGWSEEGEEIDYHFAAYTVAGTIEGFDQYEIDIKDGGLSLNVVFNNKYIPNEQTSEFFVITVYGIRLPKTV